MQLLKGLAKDKLGLASLVIIVLTLIVGVFAPVVAPNDPVKVNMALRYAAPSFEYWLGNDHLGRCVLSRLIYGIRPSIIYVLIALSLSVVLGGLLGFIAGYFKGVIDSIIMRICDIMLSFPVYVITLAIVGILGVGLENILLAFILMKWAWFARVIRVSVMQYSDLEYVKFARASGLNHFTIIYRHMLPVTFADIAVISSSSISSTILQISGLSFLGLGIQAPNPEWGMMLNEARDDIFTKPELLLPPSLAIITIVLAFNFLADALQVALNPKLTSSKARMQGEAKIVKSLLHEKEVAK
ncbi:ABC transporter permease subunit [Priestia flexa]|jgi:nickel transport system permease protein|uniref:ABC transporter permease subunit n=1 Tax=Priestia flexa TaxID=86664 RepID=A0A8I1MJ42_9BACI|nr:nickel/cobalt ABC transporter permease [Priestia flexa]MBN8253276.1 ABC transporter permease subunit [Priestia flexa]MBN8435700.1 ABC transporter permease subunit [Priestia flexa]MCA0968256.1 ABC transporter permease subunit [Priestia flexa]UIR31401.1 ABC transporter permease subunit [Priestia flexa]